MRKKVIFNVLGILRDFVIKIKNVLIIVIIRAYVIMENAFVWMFIKERIVVFQIVQIILIILNVLMNVPR